MSGIPSTIVLAGQFVYPRETGSRYTVRVSLRLCETIVQEAHFYLHYMGSPVPLGILSTALRFLLQ